MVGHPTTCSEQGDGWNRWNLGTSLPSGKAGHPCRFTEKKDHGKPEVAWWESCYSMLSGAGGVFHPTSGDVHDLRRATHDLLGSTSHLTHPLAWPYSLDERTGGPNTEVSFCCVIGLHNCRRTHSRNSRSVAVPRKLLERYMTSLNQTLHVCHICLHWGGLRGQCRHIWHTWSVWD